MPVAPFTETYLLFGFEEFCLKIHDDPALVKAVVDRIGLVGEKGMKQLCREQIDFVVFGDDMAYTEGMMISPELMRKLFFPWYRRFIRIAREAGKRVLFHSDGNVEPVIPDFIEAGLNALHPVEPKAMDIFRLKKTYGKQLAFFGNVDVDLLSRGTPDQVAAQARKLIASLAPGGGYALGSSNAVVDYVNPENYKTMLMTSWEHDGWRHTERMP
jgi:uroporphyrinogen decarboxylase